jgi:hypothetical protein
MTMQIAPVGNAAWHVRLLTRPLSVPQFAVVLAAAIAIATLYCQLYCAIAFPTRHVLPMPISSSLPWAVASVTPWLCCLELSKRRSGWSQSGRIRGLAVSGLFIAAATASIVLEAGLDQLLGIETRSLPMQAAAQLPLAAITAALLLIGPASLKANRPAAVAPDSLGEIMARSSAIRWIEAAGNYVEVHASDGVSLHRSTMSELERSLDSAMFRRIHRSLIINLSAVESRVLLGGSPAVRMADGTVLKVGRRYAANLA